MLGLWAYLSGQNWGQKWGQSLPNSSESQGTCIYLQQIKVWPSGNSYNRISQLPTTNLSHLISSATSDHITMLDHQIWLINAQLCHQIGTKMIGSHVTTSQMYALFRDSNSLKYFGYLVPEISHHMLISYFPVCLRYLTSTKENSWPFCTNKTQNIYTYALALCAWCLKIFAVGIEPTTPNNMYLPEVRVRLIFLNLQLLLLTWESG